MNTIHFYGVDDHYGDFSNFSRHSIMLDGKRWPSTEHYFQAQKFADPVWREKVRSSNSPALAARLGRDRTQKLRRDWEAVKVSVMKAALRAKFTQHPDLAELLRSTGPAKLVEHTENDSFWGDGGDGSGRNLLGQLLMQIREELLAQ